MWATNDHIDAGGNSKWNSSESPRMWVLQSIYLASNVAKFISNIVRVENLMGVSLAGGVVGLSKSISNPYWLA